MSVNLLVIGEITPQMQARLEPVFTLHSTSRMDDVPGFLAAEGASIPYVLTDGHNGVPRAWMDGLPALKLISNYGVGYDAINVVLSRQRGVMVTHTPGVLSDEVATTALMLMLAAYRNLLAGDSHVRSGGWVRDGNMALSRSADHRRVGILGLGRIGLALAKKLEPFHTEISYHNRSERNVPYCYCPDLVKMAGESDVLFIVTPGGAGTQGLVNREVIDALGPDGMLVNVSRGSVVDEPALVAALAAGRLGSAGLDVFADEPNVPAELIAMDNVVLTPHIGSATIETRRAMGDLVVDNLLQHRADGRVISPVPECRDAAVVVNRLSL